MDVKETEAALRSAIDHEFPPYFDGPAGEFWRQDVRRRAWRAAAKVVLLVRPDLKPSATTEGGVA